MSKISDIISRWSSEGVKFPFAYDAAYKRTSITLFFACVTFFLTVASAVALHFFPYVLQASIFSLAFFVICLVIYRMRQLDKIKVNLKTQEIEVDGGGKDE